jgi:hypothetical protein
MEYNSSPNCVKYFFISFLPFLNSAIRQTSDYFFSDSIYKSPSEVKIFNENLNLKEIYKGLTKIPK